MLKKGLKSLGKVAFLTHLGDAERRIVEQERNNGTV
jgi:hypothetical protein